MGPPSSSPPCGLEGHTAIYDSASQRMIVIGGGAFLGPCDGIRNSFWSFSIPDQRWSELAFTGNSPHPRVYATAVLDTSGRRVLLFGGEGSLDGGACNSDTWELSLSPALAWTRLSPDRSIPDFGTIHSAIYDPGRDRIVAYDGSEVWSYSFRDGSGWMPLATSGEGPPSLVGQGAVCDSKRNRMVVFGRTPNSGTYRPLLRDVWVLSLDTDATWTRVPTDGAFPPAFHSAAIYDPIRDQIVMVASDYYSVTSSDSVWALSAQNRWSLLATPPPDQLPRHGASVIYDSRRDRLVLFGGGFPWSDGWIGLRGSWALNLTDPVSWKSISSLSALEPTPRLGHTALYDPVEDRMIVLGGYVPGYIGSQLGDEWELEFRTNQWSPISARDGPPPSWVSQSAVYDSRRSRAVIFQGDLIWALDSGDRGRRDDHPKAIDASDGSALARGIAVPRLALAGVWPNPSTGSFLVELALPDDAPARLELLDVSGRRVWSEDVGGLGPGFHTVPVQVPQRLAPGVYLVRLAHDTATLTRKVVRLD